MLSVSTEAQARLQAHPWPGNVRELENVVMRALVLCTGETIGCEHLMFDDPGASAPVAAPAAAEPVALPQPAATIEAEAGAEAANLQQAVQLNEQQLILAAIQSTYSRMEAARKLGISPRTLRYKLAKLKGSGLAVA